MYLLEKCPGIAAPLMETYVVNLMLSQNTNSKSSMEASVVNLILFHLESNTERNIKGQPRQQLLLQSCYELLLQF